MRKRTRSLLAILLILVTAVAAVLPVLAWEEPSPRFFARVDDDVPAGFWAYDDIAWVANNQIMGGTGVRGCFEPNIPTTRSMFAKICVNFISALEKETTFTQTAPFSDVVPGAWYADAVNFCYENQILKGKGDGTFGINENITREQLCQLFCAMIENYFGKEMPVKKGVLDAFVDADTISGWARTAAEKIATAGLITGKPGAKFDPQGKATRAEAASLIQRVYRYYAVSHECYVKEDLVPTVIENFDGEGLHGWDANIWNGYTNDIDWYLPQDEMIYTEDGMLHMNVMYPGDHDVTDNEVSGLISIGPGPDYLPKFSQTYGFYEIRFKLPKARGLCSAWWICTNADGYPAQNSPDPFIEMDIFETTTVEKQLHATLHHHENPLYAADPNNRWDIQERLYVKGSKFNSEREDGTPYCIPDESMFDGEFHTAGFLWTKEGYDLYYDGNFVGSFVNTPVANRAALLRLNTYYWTVYDFAGQCYREDFDENGLDTFVVDYIHVYQLADYVDDFAPNYYGNPIPDYYTDSLNGGN